MFYKFNKQINPNKNSKGFFLPLLFFYFTLNVNAQQETFRDKNYYIDYQFFTNAAFTNENSSPLEFDYHINRTLLIYTQNLSENLNFQLAGNTYQDKDEKPLSLKPYIMRAYLKYHNESVSVSAGLLLLEQFSYQRKLWQLRYVDKNFQFKYDYGESRNTGILIKHNLNSKFTYDIAFTTGYTTPSSYTERYTIMSGQNYYAGFCTFRLFNSISLESDYRHAISFFVSRKFSKTDIGMELARVYSKNKLPEDNKYGYSVFGHYFISGNLMCFARYDMNKYSDDSEKNHVILAGVQESFKKHIRLSLFYENEDFNTNYYKLALFIFGRI